MFRQLLARISQAIPSQCMVCHAWPARPVCEACVQRFGQPTHRCRTCALPVPETLQQCRTCCAEPPPLDSVLAAVSYDYPWAGLVVQFKFQEFTGWAPFFALLLRSQPWVEPTLDATDWVLPMPLSTVRLQERGFNQALELARALASDKVQNNVLIRVMETAPQSALPRKERLRNVLGAYAVAPEHVASVAGKRIVLIDDVMTTGASLHAAAKVLRRAGAAHICAVVLARAE